MKKTFSTDNPLLRYYLIALGFIVCSFIGTISAILLLGVIFKN
jgi:hypothetical protein